MPSSRAIWRNAGDATGAVGTVGGATIGVIGTAAAGVARDGSSDAPGGGPDETDDEGSVASWACVTVALPAVSETSALISRRLPVA